MDGLKWNGEEAVRRIEEMLSLKLEWGCRKLVRHATQAMNVQALVGTHRGRSRKEGTQVETPQMGWRFRGKRKTFKEYEPSAPGEYPRKRTGWLRAHVAWEFIDKLAARWGTGVPYGRFLQTGTQDMAPRPWMSLANAEMMPELQRAFNGQLSTRIEESGGEP